MMRVVVSICLLLFTGLSSVSFGQDHGLPKGEAGDKDAITQATDMALAGQELNFLLREARIYELGLDSAQARLVAATSDPRNKRREDTEKQIFPGYVPGLCADLGGLARDLSLGIQSKLPGVLEPTDNNSSDETIYVKAIMLYVNSEVLADLCRKGEIKNIGPVSQKLSELRDQFNEVQKMFNDFSQRLAAIEGPKQKLSWRQVGQVTLDLSHETTPNSDELFVPRGSSVQAAINAVR